MSREARVFLEHYKGNDEWENISRYIYKNDKYEVVPVYVFADTVSDLMNSYYTSHFDYSMSRTLPENHSPEVQKYISKYEIDPKEDSNYITYYSLRELYLMGELQAEQNKRAILELNLDKEDAEEFYDGIKNLSNKLFSILDDYEIYCDGNSSTVDDYRVIIFFSVWKDKKINKIVKEILDKNLILWYNIIIKWKRKK